MIAYSKYKDSGIPWLGQIPEHWDVKQLSQVAFEQFISNKEVHHQNLLSLSYGNIIRKDINTAGGLLPTSFDTYQIVEEGNIVLRLTDLQNDHKSLRVGLAKEEGIITSAYVCLGITNKQELNPTYLYRLLHTYDIWKLFYSMGGGIRQGLNWQGLKKINVVLPPLAEQEKIVAFIDDKTSKIDRYIAEREKELQTLAELKQSEIAAAVTRGLNTNVPMKDSGIPWLGQIPEHWEVRRLKNVATSFAKGSGITKEEVFDDGDIQCIRYGEIYSKYNNSVTQSFSRTKLEIQKSPRYIQKGDILFAGTGELIEEIGKNIVYMGEELCLAGGDIIIMKHNEDAKFLNYLLNSNYVQTQKSLGKAKLKVVHISAFELGGIYVAIPPLAEQRAIVEYIDSKCSEINSLISNIEAEIAYF